MSKAKIAKSEAVVPVESGKKQAVNIAMQQIEKQFGKGSIMKMGDQLKNIGQFPVISTGSLALNLALGTFLGEELLKFMVQRLAGRPLFVCMPLRMRKKKAEVRPLSMLNMRLIPLGLKKLGLI